MTFTNEAAWDRVVRVLVGIALGLAAWTMWPATVAIVLATVGAIVFATGIVGWCPGYALFGWSTARKTSA